MNTIHQSNAADCFRRWGYLIADIDPLNRLPELIHADLQGFQGDEADGLRRCYCSKVGLEFMHMPYPERTAWLIERMESEPEEVDTRSVLKRILHSETFERFLHTRYVGLKRFSLEGLAAVIPLLDAILEQASEHGFENIVLGMSHRGRLNVMHHIVGTPIESIVADFEDIDPKSALGKDDVKYHKGATGVYTTNNGRELHIHLASNPSHLESIDPVVMGRVRAWQERKGDKENKKVLGILLHGDAAFAGQGIAAEALNLADIPGFRIGGTVHIVMNNMIGFTALPGALYSGRFATDIAKRLPIPIFHVNAESPDDVVRVGKTALDYRASFSSDIVIDCIGYRRFGHSEIDDPTTTAPLVYQEIASRPYLFERYAKEVGISEDDIQQLKESAESLLDVGLEKGRALTKKPRISKLPDYWEPYFGGLYSSTCEENTSLSLDSIQRLGKSITTAPDDFSLHPKIEKMLAERRAMLDGKRNLDWGMAEALAFASLLDQGVRIRLSGQDSRRGTFNHRHAVLYDTKTSAEWIPLAHLHDKQGHFGVYDSMLSEAAVLGFEYGFSRDFPEGLVCWEAQFGDFANGAQIIIDQFITSGEEKWGLLSGLVMLLPHGYEGQGPEHSSARIERFLQTAAQDNIQICQPSNSAQFFHLLRRQVLRKWRKPLIVLTPKSMLRASASCSPLPWFTHGQFQTLLHDEPRYDHASRLIFCTGKIVHELKKERAKREETDVAIVTVEQLHPFPEESMIRLLSKHKSAKTIVWVQEEPANQGAKRFLKPEIERLARGRTVTAVRRSAASSPATGSGKAHSLEQQALLRLAFMRYT